MMCIVRCNKTTFRSFRHRFEVLVFVAAIVDDVESHFGALNFVLGPTDFADGEFPIRAVEID
jgi:hypothetical protein